MRSYCDAEGFASELEVRIVIRVLGDEMSRIYVEANDDVRTQPDQRTMDMVAKDAAYTIGYMDVNVPDIERMVDRALRDSCRKIHDQLEG